ncbi:MAG TPA: hypothetical protein VE379_03530, partial [Vicinamibacterales bacterium]|nr:hypothetical protein [Vicinamibacterales bacterium]
VTQWVNMRVPDGTDYLEYMLTPALRTGGSAAFSITSVSSSRTFSVHGRKPRAGRRSRSVPPSAARTWV